MEKHLQPAGHVRRRVYFIIFAAVFVILIPVLLLYATGYRLTSHFQIEATGGVALTGVTSDMQVYINYQPQKSATFFGDSFVVKDLLPGNYFIVVAKDGYWSWAKHIEVVPQQVTGDSVLLLPEHPTLRLISPTVPEGGIVGDFNFFASSSVAIQGPNPEYTEVSALFAQPLPVPLASTTARVKDGISLWLSGPSHEDVNVSWGGDADDMPSFFCDASTTAAIGISTSTEADGAGGSSSCKDSFVDYQSNVGIKNVEFFPSRDDVVILELTDGLYALELDQTPQQNYEPIYLSDNANFRVSPEGDLYVDQGGDLYEIEI